MSHLDSSVSALMTGSSDTCAGLRTMPNDSESQAPAPAVGLDMKKGSKMRCGSRAVCQAVVGER